MRKNVVLAMLLVMILATMLFAVSCAKKVVETTPAPAPAPAAPSTPAPDRTGDAAAQEARMREERLRAEEAARMQAARNKFVNENILFEFDSAALLPESQRVLIEKAAYMRANSDIRVTIEGHCDERGTDAYNLALGERRAEAAKNFLVNLGISAARISTISYGEERPIDPAHNEAAWSKNRRAQFVVG
ncbi:MAG: peptidoglycan-associated lipoprotein Pal [Desulfobacteraceae bacterium]|nr:MAG: peptidoglycan-associated lipoprotein Pal [Desulfobacteraceae bacterium]